VKAILKLGASSSQGVLHTALQGYLQHVKTMQVIAKVHIVDKLSHKSAQLEHLSSGSSI